MANKLSAEKNTRSSKRRQQINKRLTSKAKTIEKNVHKAKSEGKNEDAQKLFSQLQSSLDKASKKGKIHKNTAARKKSRMAKLLKK